MQSAIGVFDSGLGGISVLRQARAVLPHEHFIYYGDNLHAPYGQRPEEEIRALSLAAAELLLARGIKALVIACNTATSAAAEHLRARLDIPIIGMEPALKPAHEHHRQGQIIVLATRATLRQDKFRRLCERYGRFACPVEGKGIVELVERGVLDGAEMDACLHAALDGPLCRPTDSIVLGCTHYPFVRKAIERIAGEGVRIYDGGEGTARHLADVLAARGQLSREGEGSVELLSSRPDSQPLMRRLLDMPGL